MDPITRSEAKKLGLTRYFAGQPCKNGHVAERYVSARGCVACKRYAANPEKHRAWHRVWRKANPEKRRKTVQAWQRANPEENRAHRRRWVKANPGKVRAREAHRRAAKLCATPKWANRKAIAGMYALAAEQAKEYGKPVHVDHIVPLRASTCVGFTARRTYS